MQFYCSNCGKSGHNNKRCRYPITSYGIIAYTKTKPTKFMMVQMRYTHAYVEIMRGKYSVEDIPLFSSLRVLVEQLTPLERCKLMSYEFDKLWRDLWVYSYNNPMFNREYLHARKLFNSIISTGLLKRLFDEIRSTKPHPDWVFPKGKRTPYESDADCACREFLEETGVDMEDITIHDETYTPPVYEEYTGDNGVKYRNIYYLAIANNPGIGFTNPHNLTQKSEVGKVGWFTAEEIDKLLYPCQHSKRELINNLGGGT